MDRQLNINIYMNELNFVYYINDNDTNINMLYKSISSLLKFNHINNLYIICLVDNDISNFDNLKNDLNQIHKNTNIIFLYIKNYKQLVDEKFPELPNVCNNRLRYFSLIRFFIGLYPKIDIDYFWYCDYDILFNGKIDNMLLYNQNEDKLFHFFNRKVLKKTGKVRKYYITNNLNAGIHFFNLKLYKELNCFEDLVLYYKQNYKDIIFVNQTGFEYLSNKHKNVVIQNSIIYNTNPLLISNKNFIDQIMIYHFNGPKDNNVYDVFNYLYDRIMKKQ